MRWMDVMRMAGRWIVRRGAAEGELDAELRFHLERAVAEKIAAGIPEERARRAAMLEFGGVENMKEECRETRKGNWLHDMAQDLRYGARMLRKSAGFTAVAVITLALGIGANTAIFSVIDAVLLKPLPLRQPEKVVALWETETAPGQYPLTRSDYDKWREGNGTFESMSLYSYPNTYNARSGQGTEGATVVKTEANFFKLLGVQPSIGRTFANGEDQKGGSKVAILSYPFWKARMGGEREVVNKTVELDGEAYTVIGVMPAWYRVAGRADVWVPLDMDQAKSVGSGSHQWKAIGRVKSGMTVEQARADLHRIAAVVEKESPDSNRNVTAIVVPMRDAVIGNSDQLLWLLFGAVGLVLLIACVNVANLLLSRATGRRREIAVRSALGAGRGRLTRQLLTESVMLSLMGGALGVAAAYGGVSLLRGVLLTIVPQPNPVQVGGASLLFTFGVCLVVGVLFGLAPALQSSEVASSEALKPKSSGAEIAGRRPWLRDALVVGEIGLCLMLCVGAGLLLRTFANLRAMELGIHGDDVLTATVRLPETTYKKFDQGLGFYRPLLEQLRGKPGVNAVAISTSLPLVAGSNGYITIPGRQAQAMSGPLVQATSIDGEYFRAFGIPLLAGREYSAADHELAAKFMREATLMKTEAEAMAVAKKYAVPVIINQSMARAFWPNENALGKVFDNFATFQVVGIVGDVKQFDLRSPVMPEAYYPIEWDMANPNRPYSVIVQGAGKPENFIGELRSTVQGRDASLALMQVRTMPQIVNDSMVDTQYQTCLLGAMAILALILAAVGTYGVMSYLVRQRTNEIGIRMALGAARGQIVGMVLRQAGVRVAIGIVLGVLAAMAAGRLMRGMLVGVKPIDLPTYAGVAGLLGLVALVACYLPVRSAMRVDPMVALRDE